MEENNKPEAKINNFYIKIQGGNVFAGTLSSFEEKFFEFTSDYNDETKLDFIQKWAWDQGWDCEYNYLQ